MYDIFLIYVGFRLYPKLFQFTCLHFIFELLGLWSQLDDKVLFSYLLKSYLLALIG